MILLILSLKFVFSFYDIEDLNDENLRKHYFKDSIEMEYLTAMEDFLKGNSQEAEKGFLLLSMKAFDQNWTFQERKLLVYSKLRYCQLKKEDCPSIYKEIANFSPEIIQHIDEKLFPPVIMEGLMLAKSKTDKKTYFWKPDNNWQDAKYILVNGRIYLNEEDTRIPLSLDKNRIVKIDRDYQGETFVGSAKSLLSYPFALKKVISPKMDLDIENKVAKSDLILDEIKEKEGSEKKWKKRYWLYTGLAVVASYFVYQEKREDRKSSPPIHTSKN